MEFFDDAGNYKGLVADYMNLIEERLGFKFVIVRASSWYEILDLAKQKKIDVISAAYDTPERREFLRWTTPYLEVPEVIVTRKSLTEELTLEDLTGLRVGVTLAYVVADWIRENYPQISLIMVPNDLVGLRMVSFGEIDVMIAELPIASYAIEKEKITNLRVAGQTGYSAKLSIGVRKDWPILAGIMTKGLDLITEPEREEIFRKWINLGDYPAYLNKRFWYSIVAVLLGVMGIAALVFVWNITLRRKVTEKTVALTQELNERRRIDAALRESENRLATLIGNLPGMAYRHHIESEDRWPMDYISSGCYELTGYRDFCRPGNETEFFDKVVHPEDKNKIRQIIKAALAHREPFRLTYRILASDGSVKWVWEQGVGIYSDSGEILQVEGFITDINEFKQAEEALSRSRQLFQDLVLNSLIGICIIQGARIVFQNPEQERLFGVLPADFSIFECVNIHPEDVEKVRIFLETVVAGHEESLDPDFRLFPFKPEGLDDKFRWVHCRASRIGYHGRKSLLLNMMDVTRARELEHFVSVQDKMSSLGRVAAGMAHEIRNPLSGINIHVGVAEKKLRSSEDSTRINDDLKQIKDASHNIETVIRRAMDFAKPGMPKFQPIDINHPVRQAIGLCAVSLRKSGIQLTVDLTPESLYCRADNNLIQQVLLNLVTNSAEAMKNMEDDKTIRVASMQKHGQVVVRVADSGPGVPEAIADHVFDPFFTTKSDGTGIGLSISRRIAMDHHGTLGLVRSPYGGAEFVLQLPLIKEAV
ncbi:MAG: transporter substrate-binding domain-containing protein [Desulfosarcina sp.]|nr:transporter substrate-binding domain-containing protein [Desulfosarcina sp.]MBC2764740.1 transporter substrate-binding domain-containing protein [Desulfosarcina sp.]